MKCKNKYDIILAFLKSIISILTIILIMMLTPMIKRGIYSYQQKKEHKESAEYYKTHEYPETTRGGYAQPSRLDSIPNTLRPDTLKTK
ncbi:MAG: hypothetical protein WCT13_06170 [Patescibacteria group bacterium]